MAQRNTSAGITRRAVLAIAAGVIGGSVFSPCESNPAQAAGASSNLSGGKFPNFAHGEVVRTDGVITENGRFTGVQRDIPVADHSQVLVCGAGLIWRPL